MHIARSLPKNGLSFLSRRAPGFHSVAPEIMAGGKGDRVNEALGIWKPIPDPVKVLCYGVPKKISVGEKKRIPGTSLVAEWLRLQASNGRGSGSIPGKGTRYHITQLSVHMPQLKTLPAATRPGMAK